MFMFPPPVSHKNRNSDTLPRRRLRLEVHHTLGTLRHVLCEVHLEIVVIHLQRYDSRSFHSASHVLPELLLRWTLVRRFRCARMRCFRVYSRQKFYQSAEYEVFAQVFPYDGSFGEYRNVRNEWIHEEADKICKLFFILAKNCRGIECWAIFSKK